MLMVRRANLSSNTLSYGGIGATAEGEHDRGYGAPSTRLKNAIT